MSDTQGDAQDSSGGAAGEEWRDVVGTADDPTRSRGGACSSWGWGC